MDSPELTADIAWVRDASAALQTLYEDELKAVTPEAPAEEINSAVSTVVDQLNAVILKFATIRAYLHSYITTDSYNKEALRLAETQRIRKALQETKGNKSRASELLKVSYKTLLTKIKDYEIE